MKIAVKDVTSAVGGGILIAFGLAVTAFVFVNYDIGTPRQMGPGFFPVMVGIGLAAMGLALAAMSFAVTGEFEEPALRPLVTVLAGLIGFVVVTPLFGVVPSIFVLVIIASCADGQLSLLRALGLAALLSILAVLIFQVGLGIALRMFAWPF
jgi:hypothetical protein|tara:strand:- start:32857 stop:33312 length:456 start_codon:yes stop_codon:yes gene_type:complete